MSGKTGKRMLSVLTAVALMCTSVLSIGEAPDASAAKKAKLKTKSIKVTVGKTKKIVIKKIKKRSYVFKTKNKKIATVTKKGVVKGKKAGKTTIVVKEKNGKKTKTIGKVKVTVTAKKASKETTKATKAPVENPTVTAKPTDAPAAVTTAPPVTGEQDSMTPGTPNPNATTTSVKVYVDSIQDDNLIAEVKGPGTYPTPTPDPSEQEPAEPTPIPTPQVIYDMDFENDIVEPFVSRGSSTVATEANGANDSEKCIHISGRTASWNGTQIDISSVVEVGNQYDVSYFVKQTTGATMKINTTFQYTDVDGAEKYELQKSTDIPNDTWTEVTFTTQEVPEYVGSIYLYWETPYDSDNIEDFYIDDFKMKGVVKSADESDAPDLSAGLVKTQVGNPVVTSRLTADPYAMEYNGRVYIYGTNDSQQYSLSPNADNNYAKIKTLNCYSSADMVNWTDHGEIKVAGRTGAATWAGNSWAPAAAHKTINGQEKFFLYFANSANSIGVLVADSPTGPWTDPIGKALIDRDTPGCSLEEVPWLFDPAVLVDDDGTGYLYFGGIGDTDGKDNSFIANPQCARVIKLGDDMVSTVGEAQMIDAPYMFEDSGINKIGDKYYYSYCTNWTDVPGREVGIAHIGVMVSDDPMSGFEYVGTVLKNPGSYFGSYGNNHHCFIEFKDKFYAFYHNKRDTTAIGTKADFRTTYVDELDLGENGDFTNEDGSIADTKMTVDGVTAIGTINPFETVEAETFAMADGVGTIANTLSSSNALWSGANQSLFNADIGSYIGVAGVDFGSEGATTITLKMSGSDNEDYQEYPTELLTTVTGEHTLYFVFEKENVLIDSWKFER